jgi:hypothetical protein
MTQDELDLLHSYLHDTLSEPDFARMQTLLRENADARRTLRSLATVNAKLHQLAAVNPATLRLLTAPAVPEPRRGLAWLSWRPLTAAAAGLVFGVFGATAVWAIAAVKSPRVVEVPLADAGFEAGAPIPSGNVPQRPGQWSGDPCAMVEAEGRVHPREGHHMLRFLAASTTGDFPGSKNMASDLWQVIALPGSGARTVRIRAWFNADTEKQARFHIAALAGDDASASGKDLWEQRYSEGGSLAFARLMTFVDHDPATWEAGELTLQVPPQARVLVIGIAAYRLPVEPAQNWFPAQFVDDVSVSVTEEVLP